MMTEVTQTQEKLNQIEGHGWRLGLGNLLAKENRTWWRSKRWIIQAALWTFILDGLLVLLLFIIPRMVTPDGQPVMPGNTLQSAIQGFFNLSPLALALGIIILAQDIVIGEKQSGTAEWVLSKPASRYAFILTKITANTLVVLITMITIPNLIAYTILWIFKGSVYPIIPFLSASGTVFLHVFFYLTLTIMAGVLASNRSLVLAISLGTLLGGSFLSNIVPALSLATPWMLPEICALIALGEVLPPLLIIPIISTLIWSLVFIFIALWKFQKHEF